MRIAHSFLCTETCLTDIIFKFTNVNENLESIYVLLSGLLIQCFCRFRIVHNFGDPGLSYRIPSYPVTFFLGRNRLECMIYLFLGYDL